MELPETSVNQEVGIFMVNLTFYSTDGQYLTSSARPVSAINLWSGPRQTNAHLGSVTPDYYYTIPWPARLIHI